MTRMSRIVLASCVALAPIAAAAQEPPPEAREYYERGQALYEQGRYREAIEELERAYTLDPGGTILLYNIGLIYEKLGEIDQALDHYRRYLRHELPADERARVEGMVHRLEGARTQLGHEDVSEPAPPPPSSPPPPPPSAREYGRADALFFVAAGGAAAGVIAGAVLGVLALGSDSDAESLVTED